VSRADGSGYQAAVLAELAKDVYRSRSWSPRTARKATLRRLGYERVHLRTGDGYRGPEAAPFDAVLVTASPERFRRRS
jgi:protein-L-isoaspartate(D-aspartate) O-methyltransferase